jgi:hypothetical protein
MQDQRRIVPSNGHFKRREACAKPFREMQIEMDGTLPLCCDLRSDYPEYRRSILGWSDIHQMAT